MFWIEISSHRLFLKLLRNSDFELLVKIVGYLIISSIYRKEYNLGPWEKNKDLKIAKSQSFSLYIVTISSLFKSRWFCFRNLYDNLVLKVPHNERYIFKLMPLYLLLSLAAQFLQTNNFFFFNSFKCCINTWVVLLFYNNFSAF